MCLNQPLAAGKKRIRFPDGNPLVKVQFPAYQTCVIDPKQTQILDIPETIITESQTLEHYLGCYGLFKQTYAFGIHFEVFVRKVIYIGP